LALRKSEGQENNNNFSELYQVSSKLARRFVLWSVKFKSPKFQNSFQHSTWRNLLQSGLKFLLFQNFI